MSLAITGLGMVSPAGTSAAEHVFFVRAGVVTPPPSPFVSTSGERMDVLFCPWIGARAPVVDRLTRMADAALRRAWDPLASAMDVGRARVLVCLPRPRPGFTVQDGRDLGQAIGRRARAAGVELFSGEAGAFAALARAAALFERGEARAAVLVALDSFVSPDALTEILRRPPSFWSDDVPPPSEAAAALALMPHDGARRAFEVLGAVHGAATERGFSTDDDDEPVDGAALTAILRRLPSKGSIDLVVGQAHTDELRRREWHIASARTARSYTESLAVLTLEKDTGRTGAAAGAMSLAYGVALARHRALYGGPASSTRLLAWAISGDGTRGAALAQAEAP